MVYLQKTWVAVRKCEFMKQIGFLSFGHWRRRPRFAACVPPGTRCCRRSSSAVAAEELGVDGAYFRVHHFASSRPRRSRCSPRSPRAPPASRSAPESSTCGTRTRSTWLRRPPPSTSSAEAACSWASAAVRPRRCWPATRPSATPGRGRVRRRHGPPAYRALPRGHLRRGRCREPIRSWAGTSGCSAIQPQSPTLPERIWWGAGNRASAAVGGGAGHEPHVLDPADRGHRGAVRPAAGRADRRLPGGVGSGRPHRGRRGCPSRAASFR